MRRYSLLFFLFFSTLIVSAQAQPFAEGNLDNTSVYLGQPLLYTLRVYLIDDAANTQIIPPSFVGFGRSSQVLESSVSSETRNGSLYTVVEQAYLLYPLRLGNLTIDGFQIQLPETPFQSAMTIRTEAQNVSILPLPQNAPEGFRNAIGQFDIESSANLTSLRSGDALNFTLSISGSGNIEQILAPDLNLPETWRIFDTESEFVSEGFLFGRKNFSWIIFPVGEGLVEIPSIVFSYFNPQSQQYETRRTAPISLNLLPADSIAVPIIPTREAIPTEPIALKIEIHELSPTPPLWFWALWLIAPLIAFGAWLVQKPKSEKVPETKKSSGSRAIQVFKQDLKAAQASEPKLAYSKIENAFFHYLAAKTGKQVDVSNAESFLKHLPAPMQEELLACLEESSTGRYAPIAKSDVNVLLRRALEIISTIDKEWR